MARGNQRDKAREKTQKEKDKMKGKTVLTGVQMNALKEAQADIMRRKQEAAKEKKSDEKVGQKVK